MKRWRLWRISRAYRLIARTELRAEFTQGTLAWLGRSMSRQQRRRWKRDLVRSA